MANNHHPTPEPTGKFRLGLLAKVIIAIILGIMVGKIAPEWFARASDTVNVLFSNLLGFMIPLIIVGLVAPGIAELGRGAGRLLAVTAALAYGSTLFSGFFAYFACRPIFARLIQSAPSSPFSGSEAPEQLLAPFFRVEIPPLMDVMSALVLAFALGLGLAVSRGNALRNALSDFKEVIEFLIVKLIIPLLPLYIFTIFVQLTQSGQVAQIFGVFYKVVLIIFALHLLLLLIQFTVAGLFSGRHPLKMLRTMLPAYLTALGTQSSAATIPVTLKQVLSMGIRPEVAQFTVPLCATIHLAGSTLKIVCCAMAIMYMQGMPFSFGLFAGFIALLGIAMVAAPGVPGGAIMAAVGVLQSILGFNEQSIALMIALYIAMDSFGTAGNVTGDGAISAIVDKWITKK